MSALEQHQLLCTLKTIAEASNKKDLLSLNNMIYLAQRCSLLQLYDDFKGFGKLGVSSVNLGWDYNSLTDSWEGVAENEGPSIHKVVRFAKLLANISSHDLGLIACMLFDEKFLTEKERIKANDLMRVAIQEKL